jgi:hypothetical protein
MPLSRTLLPVRSGSAEPAPRLPVLTQRRQHEIQNIDMHYRDNVYSLRWRCRVRLAAQEAENQSR